MDLPICHNCPSECKPGEDLCWACLGEDPNQLPWEYEWGPFDLTPGNLNYVSDVKMIHSVTLSGITTNFPNPIYITNGDTITITTTSGASIPITYTITGGTNV